MIITKNKSFHQVCEQHLELAAMVKIIRDDDLTIEELVILNKVIVGCTKLTYSNLQHLNKAMRRSKDAKKFLALGFTYGYIKGRGNEKFRPSDIRTSFSDSVKDIQYSDLTDILKVLTKTNILSKINATKNIRGRTQKNQIISNALGVKSYYEGTEYFKCLNELISKPIARKLIHIYLSDAKIIQRYLIATWLFVLYSLKYSDMNELGKMLQVTKKSHRDIEKITSRFKPLFDKVSSSSNGEIRAMATKLAEEEIRKRNWKESDPLYDDLYLTGGILFNA